MTMKDQLLKLKENWLLIAILVVVFVMMSGGADVMNKVGGVASFATDSMMMEQSYRGSISPPGYANEFAPEVEERVIIKTASIGSEVERGLFLEAEQRLNENLSSRYEEQRSYAPMTCMVTELSQFLGVSSMHMVDFLTTVYDQELSIIR